MLEVLPLTHIRGRSLHDAFVIVDEAQSLERNVLLTVLSPHRPELPGRAHPRRRPARQPAGRAGTTASRRSSRRSRATRCSRTSRSPAASAARSPRWSPTCSRASRSEVGPGAASRPEPDTSRRSISRRPRDGTVRVRSRFGNARGRPPVRRHPGSVHRHPGRSSAVPMASSRVTRPSDPSRRAGTQARRRRAGVPVADAAQLDRGAHARSAVR